MALSDLPSRATAASITVVEFGPAVSYKVADHFSIGLSVGYQMLDTALEAKINLHTACVGGAVQRQEHAVERSRRAQPRERLGEDPVEERLVAGTARAHCGEQGGQSCPWPGAVHAAREAEDGAWAARRSGVEIRGEVVAGEQDIRLELGARRHRSVAVGFQHEPAYGDARRGVDGPGHRIGLPC